MLNIIYDGNGQMCNKLLFLAQILSSSFVRGFDIKYYNFHLSNGMTIHHGDLDKRVTFIEEKHKSQSLIMNMSRAARKLKLKNSKMLFITNKKEALAVENKLLTAGSFNDKHYYWCGWPYMDYTSLRSCADKLRECICFTDETIQCANAFLNRSQYDFVCGIHLRRGDYKDWHNGKYYYGQDVYMRVVNEIIESKSKDSKIAVLLCSNEPIDSTLPSFPNTDFYISDNTPAVDLCLLSQCDLLVGPPSTFSGWASFIGNKKRFLLDERDKPYTADNCFVWLTETDGWGNPL